ncbi:hypothetical protein DAPPUDRAFT_233874 [Daphnia pulex]|uniref:Uncharacterized protein n=1 Tax=Daphnia pulex TaxID=6669 RepID=E9FVZ7_DAPPU|nr:hypothetical protein DAPPUDRAFT_233874 [Daphnia pulex]|eukprot:EFX89014.1 hypothetical protein DAPPUDRAFT_233874 [Daphnia pulex]
MNVVDSRTRSMEKKKKSRRPPDDNYRLTKKKEEILIISWMGHKTFQSIDFDRKAKANDRSVRGAGPSSPPRVPRKQLTQDENNKPVFYVDVK